MCRLTDLCISHFGTTAQFRLQMFLKLQFRMHRDHSSGVQVGVQGRSVAEEVSPLRHQKEGRTRGEIIIIKKKRKKSSCRRPSEPATELSSHCSSATDIHVSFFSFHHSLYTDWTVYFDRLLTTDSFRQNLQLLTVTSPTPGSIFENR